MISRTGWSARFQDVSDGLSKTFLVGECVGALCITQSFASQCFATTAHPINYLNESLAADMPTIDNPRWDESVDFRSYHAGGALFATCDAAVQFIDNNIDGEIYRSLAYRAEGEIAANRRYPQAVALNGYAMQTFIPISAGRRRVMAATLARLAAPLAGPLTGCGRRGPTLAAKPGPTMEPALPGAAAFPASMAGPSLLPARYNDLATSGLSATIGSGQNFPSNSIANRHERPADDTREPARTLG